MKAELNPSKRNFERWIAAVLLAKAQPPTMSALTSCVSHQARLSYLGLYSIRRSFTTSTISKYSSSSPQHPSDPAGSSYTRGYVTGAPISGPIGEAASYGIPSITPKDLGQYLSRFVVGQERAKRRLCAEVYNHYNRVRELRRRNAEADSLCGQTQQDAAQRHPAECRRIMWSGILSGVAGTATDLGCQLQLNMRAIHRLAGARDSKCPTLGRDPIHRSRKIRL